MSDDMSEATSNGNAEKGKNHPASRSLLESLRQWRVDADKGREPKFFSSRMGTRQVSIAALLEKIVTAFVDEHAGGSPALKEATTETKRLSLILATANYVLAVESIQLSDNDKAEIIHRAYTELFTYGPLDDLFEDERITTISIEGTDKVSIRYGHGELQPLKPLFEDEAHLRTIISRLLLDSGAELSDEMPIIEAGLQVAGRRVSINVAGPPVTIHIGADIRLHPIKPVSLQDMTASGFVGETASTLLSAIAKSAHGVVIVGDTESGKTSMLGALLGEVPEVQRAKSTAVERAGELQLPDAVARLVVQWPIAEREAITFAEQVNAALATEPSLMLLDEVRTDEAHAVGHLLANEQVPRQMWAFRGPADSKRLTSALGMLARRSVQPPLPTADKEPDKDAASPKNLLDGEVAVRRLYERLPFVITLRRRKGQVQLYSIAEWQFPEGQEYPNYVELMEMGWEGVELTGTSPLHPLDLPDAFWHPNTD